MANTQTRLPMFDGRKVETQRLSQSGSVDKDQWAADPHEGDQVVYTITRSRISRIDHKFIEDGVIRIEHLDALEMFVEESASGAIADLWKIFAAEEAANRRERSGNPNLDDAVDEAARAAELGDDDPPAGGDELAGARSARATKAAKKATKTPRKR